jgi:hypothetical protein
MFSGSIVLVLLALLAWLLYEEPGLTL